MPADAAPDIWEDIAGTYDSIDNFFDDDATRQAQYRHYATARLQPAFARVGWQAKAGESAPTTILRTELIGTLGGLGDPDVLAEARRRYDAQATDADAMPAELRSTILGIVARNADAATWDKLHAAARAEQSSLVKDRLYRLLAASEDATLAQRALDLALTDEPGATNSAGMISTVSRRHPDLAFDFAVAHREQVDKLVDSTSRSRYYPGLGGGSRDLAMIGKIKTFADAHIAPTSRRAAETAIAGIEYRAKLRKDRLPEIDAWLKKNGG
jgi:aminopeptidase N